MSYAELETWEDYFPYEPRPLQKNMLAFISKKVEERFHMVIEAANGTGKTITALAGLLPYARRNEKKIIYLARTHSQIDRVISELKEISKTKPVSGIALRGRGSMCLNYLVQKEATTNRQVQDLCQQLKTANRCDFYNNMKTESRVFPVLKELARQPADASIILEMAEAADICPAETANLALARADVIACSYLYLFDPDILQSFLRNLQKEMSDLIVVIDECHNLPDNVSQINSDELTSFSINRAISEARRRGKYNMVDFMENLQEYIIDKTRRAKFDQEVAIDPGYLMEDLDQKGKGYQVEEDFFNIMMDVGNDIRQSLAKRGKEPQSYLGRVGEFCWQWWFSLGRKDFTHSVEKRKLSNSRESFVVLRLDSLDPSKAILPVLEEVDVSLSISGSIGDANSFLLLTGIDQLKHKTNILPSPYSNANIRAVITKELTTSYRARSPQMWLKMINSIVALVENTPTNTGIFAPSYSIMRELMNSGLESKLRKPVVYVKQGLSSKENDDLVHEFKSYASRGGAVLVSVLGGRSSEGADFPGELMQSVAVIGIPYAPPNIRVDAKIAYLNTKFPGKGRKLSYQLPAINRASQAAGRPVRSLTDKAFILLVDFRYAQNAVKFQLPGWIRESLEEFDYDPVNLGREVRSFFG